MSKTSEEALPYVALTKERMKVMKICTEMFQKEDVAAFILSLTPTELRAYCMQVFGSGELFDHRVLNNDITIFVRRGDMALHFFEDVLKKRTSQA